VITKPKSRILSIAVNAVVILLLILIIIFVFLYFFRAEQGNLSVRDAYGVTEKISGEEFKSGGTVSFLKSSSGDRISSIEVEVADTPEEARRGLMYRKNLSEDHGMLFIFDDYRERRFHMRNTNISLDIIFADSTGKIVKIHKNAAPFSESKFYSGKPVKYAVEVNAGYTDKYHISEGDIFGYEIY
jgi:uncharacterized membrane protein (UPF0127 family)